MSEGTDDDGGGGGGGCGRLVSSLAWPVPGADWLDQLRRAAR